MILNVSLRMNQLPSPKSSISSSSFSLFYCSFTGSGSSWSYSYSSGNSSASYCSYVAGIAGASDSVAGSSYPMITSLKSSSSSSSC